MTSEQRFGAFKVMSFDVVGTLIDFEGGMLKRRRVIRLGLIFAFAVPLAGHSNREISGKSAQERNDDITVVSMRRAAC